RLSTTLSFCPFSLLFFLYFLFFFTDTATTDIYTLSLHDALPILVMDDLGAACKAAAGSLSPDASEGCRVLVGWDRTSNADSAGRSEEHTSELQSLAYLVCRLLLEKKKKKKLNNNARSQNRTRAKQ